MKLKAAAELVESAFNETLTYYAYPLQHWPKLKTSNPMERLLREARRRAEDCRGVLRRVIGNDARGRPTSRSLRYQRATTKRHECEAPRGDGQRLGPFSNVVADWNTAERGVPETLERIPNSSTI